MTRSTLTTTVKKRWQTFLKSGFASHQESIANVDEVLTAAFSGFKTLEEWWEHDEAPGLEKALNLLHAELAHRRAARREAFDAAARARDIPAWPPDDLAAFYARWRERIGGEYDIDILLGLPRRSWGSMDEAEKKLGDLAQKKMLDRWFPREENIMAATCKVSIDPDGPLEVDGLRFSVDFYEVAGIDAARAIMRAVAAEVNAGKLTVVAGRVTQPPLIPPAASQPPEDAGEEKPRQQMRIARISRSKVNDKVFYTIWAMLNNGKPSQYPQDIKGDFNISRLEEGLHKAGFTPERWPLGEEYNLPGLKTWIQGKPTGSVSKDGKTMYHQDDMQFEFTPKAQS